MRQQETSSVLHNRNMMGLILAGCGGVLVACPPVLPSDVSFGHWWTKTTSATPLLAGTTARPTAAARPRRSPGQASGNRSSISSGSLVGTNIALRHRMTPRQGDEDERFAPHRRCRAPVSVHHSCAKK